MFRKLHRTAIMGVALAASLSLFTLPALALHGDWPDWCNKQKNPPLMCWIIAL